MVAKKPSDARNDAPEARPEQDKVWQIWWRQGRFHKERLDDQIPPGGRQSSRLQRAAQAGRHDGLARLQGLNQSIGNNLICSKATGIILGPPIKILRRINPDMPIQRRLTVTRNDDHGRIA